MFVQDFMIVERPSAELVATLEPSASRFFHNALRDAEADFEQLRGKVGPDSWPLLAKTVEIGIGPVRKHGDVTLFAFSWQATGPGAVFPALDADLEVSPLGETSSEIAIRGRYEPPGGAVGRSLDRLLLHRLADATLRAFLTRLADRLAVSGAPASS